MDFWLAYLVNDLQSAKYAKMVVLEALVEESKIQISYLSQNLIKEQALPPHET